MTDTQQGTATPAARWVPVLAGATVFLSAGLLFTVQLCVAKTTLPWFGGSAAMWATSIVFYQAVLLAGYAYADLVVRCVPPRWHAAVHVALLAASLALLPIGPTAVWRPEPGAAAPQLRLLAMLAATVGLPCIVLSATSPLASAWVARAARGARPYRLYALSNAGSLIGLCGYPLLVEPAFATSFQSIAWSALYVLFALLCAAVAFVAARGTSEIGTGFRAVTSTPPIAARERAVWIALGFAPSALLVTITNHLTQNVAAVPLLWVLPLTVYLASFILCFSAEGRWYRRAIVLPLVPLLLAAMLWSSGISGDARRDTFLFLTGLFIVATACHGELARRAPDPSRLTGYYLAMSTGGVLGGAAVSFVVPAILPASADLPVMLTIAAGLLALALDHVVRKSGFPALVTGFRTGAAIVVVGLGAAGAAQVHAALADTRVTGRNFYGALSVHDDGAPGQFDAMRDLFCGQISHGVQFLDPRRRNEPTAYYGLETGIGGVLTTWKSSGPRRIGVVGLGVGTLAAYGRPGDTLRFYEINPLVVEFAQREFTFLADTQAEVSIAHGDARLVLEAEPPQRFDVLALDAFSGDAVPVHLLTREAMAVYRRQLADDGLLAVHVTNRYIDLVSVVVQAARREGADAKVVVTHGMPGNRARYRATWVLLAWPQAAKRAEWAALGATVDIADGRPWTDDYSDLWGAMK